HQADVDYITNTYPVGDLAQFKATGVLVNNGEEHRHNFNAQGEGYGHLMFLNIKSLVKPVSLGPGITGDGFDDRPLRPGIEEALKAGRCQVTNGPLLSVKVEGKTPGDVLDLATPRKLKVEASAAGRLDFQELQLVHNGKVIARQAAAKKGGFEARLVSEVTVD